MMRIDREHHPRPEFLGAQFLVEAAVRLHSAKQEADIPLYANTFKLAEYDDKDPAFVSALGFSGLPHKFFTRLCKSKRSRIIITSYRSTAGYRTWRSL